MRKTLALLMATMMVVALLAPAASASIEDQIKRIEGANRWETSAKTALEAYPNGVDDVIIVRGDNAGQWADGLAGGYLAGVLNAPVLVTPTAALPDAVKDAIETLDPNNAHILGGTAAVSANVETELAAMDLNVVRIDGDTRMATAAEIAKEGVAANTAFIANGWRPADSMVAGAAAAKDGYPILLVTSGGVPEETAAAIDELDINDLYIVGGTAVVSQAIEDELNTLVEGTVTRLGGANRVMTSLLVAAELFEGAEDFSIVNGYTGLVDAVGASVFEYPILYVLQNEIEKPVRDYLVENVYDESIIYIFGGLAAISQVVEDELTTIVEDADPKPVDPTEVVSIEVVNATTTVPFGTSIEDAVIQLNASTTYHGVLEDGSTTTLTVADWESDDYSTTTADTYEFTGTAELPEGYVFAYGVSNEVTGYVVVEEEISTSMTDAEYRRLFRMY